MGIELSEDAHSLAEKRLRWHRERSAAPQPHEPSPCSDLCCPDRHFPLLIFQSDVRRLAWFLRAGDDSGFLTVRKSTPPDYEISKRRPSSGLWCRKTGYDQHFLLYKIQHYIAFLTSKRRHPALVSHGQGCSGACLRTLPEALLGLTTLPTSE